MHEVYIVEKESQKELEKLKQIQAEKQRIFCNKKHTTCFDDFMHV